MEFAAGSSELATTAADKLTTLAAGAAHRPELILVVEGAWDAEADSTGLKEIVFEEQMAGQQASLEFFESMYHQADSSESLDGLRAENMKADETTGEQVLDETDYYLDLSSALIEAQPVDAAEVQALAGARAEAIRAFLVDELGVAAGRVRVIDPEPLEESKEDNWIRCRLDVE